MKLTLLGGYSVEVDGLTIGRSCWTRRNPQLLIKLLGIQTHHALHRERIIEQLWPETEPALAANNLDKTIHRARAVLQPGLPRLASSTLLRTELGRVYLGKSVTTDADEFERATLRARRSDDILLIEHALQMYGGELLPDDIYVSWCAPMRTRLGSLHRQLMLRAAVLYGRAGRFQLALQTALQVTETHACDEEAHRIAACAWVAVGQSARAIRQLDLCGETMRSQLGLELSRPTRCLRALIVSDSGSDANRVARMPIESMVSQFLSFET